MKYDDLSIYTYGLPFPLLSVRNVGWLEADSRPRVGSVSAAFVNALGELVIREEVNATRGIHACEFCGQKGVWVQIGRSKAFLGKAEIWVPSPAGELIY